MSKIPIYLHKYQNEILSQAPLQTIIVTSKSIRTTKKCFNKNFQPNYNDDDRLTL